MPQTDRTASSMGDRKGNVMIDRVILHYEKAAFKNDKEKFVFEYPIFRLKNDSGLILEERTLDYFIFDDSVCYDSREFCLGLGKVPKAEFHVGATNLKDGMRRLEFQFVR